jgi:hypothetical protein
MFFVMNPFDQLQNIRLSLPIERSGGFIKQEDLRFLRQAAGNGRTLLFSAG